MINKDYGNIGEARAISFYTENGYKVSKPLFENCPYDLIVDLDGELFRVQVKTSRCKVPSGKYEVNFRTFGGNRSGISKIKNIDPKLVDIVFILLEDGRTFQFPVKDLEGRSRIHL